jgi:tetratricopeptide (TPR) repeat protein
MPRSSAFSFRLCVAALAGIAWSGSAGCKRNDGEVSPNGKAAKPAQSALSPSSQPSARTSLPGPSASASAHGSKVEAPSDQEAAELERKYRAPLARARKLQGEGKFADAEQAFIEASGKGQDIYYRAIAELGYLELTHESAASDTTEFTLLVATNSAESDVQAQAWFNLATLYRNLKKPEAERAALSRSLASRPGAAAKAKLGQRSACVAELGPRKISSAPLIVKGWVGVCAQFDLCKDAPSASESEARKLACLKSPGVVGPEESHGCAGTPPWESTYRYLSYSMEKAFIAPAGKGTFFVAETRVGGWPSICGGDSDFSAELVGDTVYVTETQTYSDVGRGHAMPQSDPENGVCWDAHRTQAYAVYDVKTAKLLAALSIVGGLPVDATVDTARRRLRLARGGCDGFMPLDGSQRFVPESVGP